MAKINPEIERRNAIRAEYPDHPLEHGEKAIRRIPGRKVHWEVFATIEEAERAAHWAMVEGEIRSRQGYDAGYQTPGTFDKVEDGYRVCIL